MAEEQMRHICAKSSPKTHKFANVMLDDLITAIRTAIRTLKLEQDGINPDLVGVHSLRAGGAMSLKLQGESDTTIM